MMTIALPTELEELVNTKIQSGQYHSAGEVIRESLRLVEEEDMLRQIKLEQLRKDVAAAVEAEERGEVAPLDIEDIIAWGKNRRARNLFERPVNAHANRMVSARALDEASLVTLYPEDIPNA